MADRGAVFAVQTAEQTSVGVYQHVMEPTAAFPGSLASYDADEQVVELAAYAHPFDGPTGPTAFGAFTIDGSGTGYYMQPADNTQDALQALSNGRSAVSGTLRLDMPLIGTSVGAATSAAALKLAFQLGGSSVGAATTSSPFLAFLKLIEAQVAGSSFVRSPLLGLLGRYRAAVLASAPDYFLHFDETSGTTYFDDPTLGGEAITTGSSGITRSTSSLVETERGGKLRMGTDNSNFAGFTITQAAAPATLAYSIEFWFRAVTAFTPLTIMFSKSNAQTNVQVNGPAAGRGLNALRAGPTSFYGPGYVEVNGSTNIVTDNQPHHCVITYDPTGNGTLRTYVDGVQDGEATAAQPRDVDVVSTTWAQLPNWQKGSSNYPYELDELAYYTRTLSSAEIATHYQAANFALRLNGSPLGIATATGDLTFAGGVIEYLEGSSAGSSLLYGNLVTGILRELAGTALGAGSVTPPLLLKYGPLGATQTAVYGGPKKHAIFSRSKI